MSSTLSLTLYNGAKIPSLGFGTWLLKGSEVINPLKWALEAGYRHIGS